MKYTKLQTKINELNALGYRVKFRHEREYVNDRPVNQGGLTEAIIENRENPDDKYVGRSQCSIHENFNRKRGNTIAFGRALVEFQKSHV